MTTALAPESKKRRDDSRKRSSKRRSHRPQDSAEIAASLKSEKRSSHKHSIKKVRRNSAEIISSSAFSIIPVAAGEDATIVVNPRTSHLPEEIKQDGAGAGENEGQDNSNDLDEDYSTFSLKRRAFSKKEFESSALIKAEDLSPDPTSLDEQLLTEDCDKDDEGVRDFGHVVDKSEKRKVNRVKDKTKNRSRSGARPMQAAAERIGPASPRQKMSTTQRLMSLFRRVPLVIRRYSQSSEDLSSPSGSSSGETTSSNSGSASGSGSGYGSTSDSASGSSGTQSESGGSRGSSERSQHSSDDADENASGDSVDDCQIEETKTEDKLDLKDFKASSATKLVPSESQPRRRRASPRDERRR